MKTRYAAFDPIFWLHHAQVHFSCRASKALTHYSNLDRIFALWQAVYPDAYITPHVNKLGTFSTAANTLESEDSLLTPFSLDSTGKMHSATTARYTTNFGYTYPELPDWTMSKEELIWNVTNTIRRLYGDSHLPSITANPHEN